NNGALNKEKLTLPTLNASDNFWKKVRNVFLVSFSKGSEFGTPKGVESRDTNVEILEDFIEKLGKGQPKVCKAERMSVKPNISVKSIKDRLVRFGKYDIVLRGNRVEFEEVGYLYPCKHAGLSTNGILSTHSKRNKSDD
ncbi:hypothetical protein Tco_0883071, partial [Tanacetum coccineum]